jgi:hypothetical protein
MNARETARLIVIERGAGYFSGLLDGSGIDLFSKLPADAYRRIIERAAGIAAKGENHADTRGTHSQAESGNP